MANVAAPRNGIPIGTARIGGQIVQVEVHPEYLRWFDSLVFRLGGVTGATSTDLAQSSFEDAGIEESKLAIFRVADDAAQVPPSVVYAASVSDPSGADQAHDQLNELEKAFDAFQQCPAAPQHVPQVDDDVSPGIEQLRAQVAELTKAVHALQEGLTA